MKVDPLPGEALERKLGRDVLVMAPARVTFGGWRGCTVVIEVRPDLERGKLAVTSMTVASEDGRDVTLERMKSLGLGTLRNRARSIATGVVEPLPEVTTPAGLARLLTTGSTREPSPLRLRASRRALQAQPKGGAWRWTDDELRRVAKAWRRADKASRPTGAEVAADVGVTPDVARQLVRLCRKRVDPRTGQPFLPPTGGTTRPTLTRR